MHAAIRDRNVDAMRLIANRDTVNEPTGYGGHSPLHTACMMHKFEEGIEFLIAAGANVNVQDDMGWTPLHCGWTPLHAACAAGNLDVIDELIAAGADIDAQTTDGEQNTPLHLASQRGNVKVVTKLLENGAEATIKNKENCFPRDVSSLPSIQNVFSQFGGGVSLKAAFS